MQKNIDLVHTWFKEWFMEFNISKCKFMVISRKQSRCGPPTQLLMDGVGLETENEIKYLGVWLSDTLGWLRHVNKIVQRAFRQMGMIYRTFNLHSS